MKQMLSYEELLQLKRLNTPTIYNGWEQLTKHDRARDAFNLEETRDFMPQMGVWPVSGTHETLIITVHERVPADTFLTFLLWPENPYLSNYHENIHCYRIDRMARLFLAARSGTGHW